MARILVTNGGPHSASDWAMATAEHIFQIGPDMAGGRLLDAKEFQLKLAKLLLPHHEGHQHHVRGKLKEHGDAHLDAPYTPEERAKASLADIVALSKGTPWETHFAKPEVQDVVVNEICTHFATSDNIERQWHCHRNPDSHAGRVFLAKHHPQEG